MTDEAGADTKLVKMIVFAVGEQEYCIPILSVREIRGFEKTTALPFAPHYVCGAINLRGIILTVIDLAVYLNVEPLPDNPRRVVVIVESRNGTVCGLLVDRVIDMADVNLADIQAVAEEDSSLSGLVMIADRMIGVLRLEVVVGQLVGGMTS
ncbi:MULTISPECIES: chemotaxis protein CheW [Acetobacter]|uniref:Purine-binding chemotaxis protein CheW n=1 Tax=Acetobacter lovaniensis TaxID=104100 RepID=A0A841QG27_9PROT|nr:chemotaxis protein CheW [Acetobacter lovaniensis]MBB6457143.1 purine-binding chemotaxis protein CheW [Acetobacter lovaniensis]MCI1697724.1 chemotaxis protein CheW [Acetobacter lovaniensis]MCI1795107.1 chemotaxis protein CheW [Acetobacter lovaniensis]MCP1239515.1 chemotaxis protein CheW [Acetobacter lovaniensis]NHN81275.1 chemotaxis protein CheW [Acetobacter lovaniensis]